MDTRDEQRRDLVRLTNIRIEVWKGADCVRVRHMNWARLETRQWFQTLLVWAWSTGHRVVTQNTAELHGQANSKRPMASGRDEQQ